MTHAFSSSFISKLERDDDRWVDRRLLSSDHAVWSKHSRGGRDNTGGFREKDGDQEADYCICHL